MTPRGNLVPSLGASWQHLVGRKRERQVLGNHLAAALRGRGKLVLISGEAGAGKTVLGEALCLEAASQGALVLIGGCYDLSFPPPYGPWVELFQRYEQSEGLPSPPAAFAQRGALATIASQPALFEEVRDFFARLTATRPLVILLEDLHWADPASLDLLRYLARETSAQALLVLATVNADELGRRHPLYRLLPVLEREAGAERLNLPRLCPDDLRALIAASYGLREADVTRLVDYLCDMTGGNAFFATQLLRALEEQGVLQPLESSWSLKELAHVGVPLALRQVIDARLLRLQEEAQELLAAAAVIGQEVPFSLWTSVVGGEEEGLLRVLEEATNARLVEPAPDGINFRFVHALIREALYEGIFPLRRSGLHRRVGEALAALPAPNPDAVAHHFERANDKRTAEWLVKAGERAERASALLTAVERYEAALAPMEEHGGAPAEQAWLLLRLGILRRLDDSRKAVSYVEAAVRLANKENDPGLSARVLLGRGLVRCYAGAIRRGLTDLEAGVAAVEALPPTEVARRGPEETVDSVANRGTLIAWLALSGRLTEARALAQGYLGRATVPETDHEKAMNAAGAWWGLALVHALQGRVEEARRAYAAARAAYQFLDQHRLLFIALRDELVYLVLPYQADDAAERERSATALRRTATRGSAVRAFVDAIDNVRYPLLHLMAIEGRWQEARRVVEAMGNYGIPILRHVASSVLGPIARAQGDAGLAWRLVRETWPEGPATEPGSVEVYHTLPQQRLAVELSLDEGNLSAARAWLDAHDRWLAWSKAVLGLSEGRVLWARYEWASGNAQRARWNAEQALKHASEPRQPLAMLAALRLLGELDAAAHRYDAAEAYLDDALALADACATPYERALTLLAQAELRLAIGEGATASNLLDEARGICSCLCATPALARADALADEVSKRRRAVTSCPGGLTKREAEVLGLLAQGFSNKEIAAILYLSPRTVGRHVAKAYRKIGVHRRAEATAYALRHGLVHEEQRSE